MNLIIVIAGAVLAIATLWFQLGALALVVAPLAGLFLLLTLAPLCVEAQDVEHTRAELNSTPRPMGTVAVDTDVRWGVLYVADR